MNYFEDHIFLANGTYVTSYIPSEREELCFVLKNALSVLVRLAEERAKRTHNIDYNEASARNLDNLYEIYLENMATSEIKDTSMYLSKENMSVYIHRMDYSKFSDGHLEVLKQFCWDERYHISSRDNLVHFSLKIEPKFHINLNKEYTFLGKPVFALEAKLGDRIQFSIAKSKSRSVTHQGFINGAVAHGYSEMFRGCTFLKEVY